MSAGPFVPDAWFVPIAANVIEVEPERVEEWLASGEIDRTWQSVSRKTVQVLEARTREARPRGLLIDFD